jgi:hypothetical protein
MILSIDDYELSLCVPIEIRNHEKQHMFSWTLEEVLFENKPYVSLIVYLHP